MDVKISVVIPNRNGGATIGECLESLTRLAPGDMEIVVVDDCSKDDSVETIAKFPCRLIRLDRHSGASRARNAGVAHSSGEILFFLDADCVVTAASMAAVVEASRTIGKDTVIGGTYTPVAFDDTFFSTFQSVFINYSELKHLEPDYVATHAMLIRRDLFLRNGGFPEHFLPILEDVEFCHRLRRAGVKLRMNPAIRVRHIFRFSLWKSLRNAFRKSRYWTVYSMKNRDVLADSGTASRELKTNVFSFFSISGLLLLSPALGWLLPLASVIAAGNIAVNRNLLSAFASAKGPSFAIGAALYYLLVYPLAVGAGSFSGLFMYFSEKRGEGTS